MENTHYVYREAASKKELKALLHLRYDIYKESRLAAFIEENPFRLNLDGWSHQLVTSGPYGLVRHPSYLGAYLAFLGLGLFLQSWGGILVAAILMGIAYFYRITAEEITLVGAFGEDYRQYQAKTKRLFPLVW